MNPFRVGEFEPSRIKKLNALDLRVAALEGAAPSVGGVAGVSSFNARAGAVSLTLADVTAALTFTPQPAGSYAAAAHVHAIGNVTGLQAALDAKQASGDYATNTALTNGLAGKQAAGSYLTGITGPMVTAALTYTPTSVAGLTGSQTLAAFKTGLALAKGDVGLGSVDNTADSAKAVLTATKLATARAINGVSFDGSAPITINAVDSTARLAAAAVSAFGLTLIDDADAATARGTLGLGSAALSAASAFQPAGTYATGTGSATGANSGDETYSSITAKLAAGSGGGTANFLRADGTFAAPPAGAGGGVTEVTGTAPIASSGGTAPAISISAATAAAAGSMSAQDKTRLDAAFTRYHSLLDCSGSHTAARAAGTYGMGQGDPLAITGTGTLYPLNVIYIDPADYPAAGTLAAKLRLRIGLMVNDVAPTGNFTFGLHPVSRPATSGAAGLSIYTIGAALAGSTVTVSAPAADSSNNAVSADFALPASAGWYALGMVASAAVATSSHLHISGLLQMRYA